MSRLDSFIRRLEAQRACLDLAAARVAGRPGVIFELGLGNGRTFDHLREKLPGRQIIVFDRQVAAHPACIPIESCLVLGDISETLPRACERYHGEVVLVHSDIGSGDEASNARIAAFLSKTLPPALAPGALVLSDQELSLPGARSLPLPEGVKPGRYFLLEMA
jgi:hypothetical protein